MSTGPAIAALDPMPERLTESLIRRALLDPQRAREAMQRQVLLGGALDTCLLELKLVPEPALLEAMSGAYGLATATMQDVTAPLDARASRAFPEQWAKKHTLAPLALDVDRQILTVLSPAPADVNLLVRLGELLELTIKPLLAPEYRVHQRLALLYEESPPERFRQLIDQSGAELPGAHAADRHPKVVTRPLTFGEAVTRLKEARGRDDIVQTALAYARRDLEFAAMFIVHEHRLDGWMAVGEGSDNIAGVTLSLTAESAFRVVLDTQAHYLGPLPDDALHMRFLESLGRPHPRAALIVPVRIKSRTIALMYGENGPRTIPPRLAADLMLFTTHVQGALESLLLRRKVESLSELPAPSIPAAPASEPTPVPRNTDYAFIRNKSPASEGDVLSADTINDRHPPDGVLARIALAATPSALSPIEPLTLPRESEVQAPEPTPLPLPIPIAVEDEGGPFRRTMTDTIFIPESLAALKGGGELASAGPSEEVILDEVSDAIPLPSEALSESDRDLETIDEALRAAASLTPMAAEPVPVEAPIGVPTATVEDVPFVPQIIRGTPLPYDEEVQQFSSPRIVRGMPEPAPEEAPPLTPAVTPPIDMEPAVTPLISVEMSPPRTPQPAVDMEPAVTPQLARDIEPAVTPLITIESAKDLAAASASLIAPDVPAGTPLFQMPQSITPMLVAPLMSGPAPTPPPPSITPVVTSFSAEYYDEPNTDSLASVFSPQASWDMGIPASMDGEPSPDGDWAPVELPSKREDDRPAVTMTGSAAGALGSSAGLRADTSEPEEEEQSFAGLINNTGDVMSREHTAQLELAVVAENEDGMALADALDDLAIEEGTPKTFEVIDAEAVSPPPQMAIEVPSLIGPVASAKRSERIGEKREKREKPAESSPSSAALIQDQEGWETVQVDTWDEWAQRANRVEADARRDARQTFLAAPFDPATEGAAAAGIAAVLESATGAAEGRYRTSIVEDSTMPDLSAEAWIRASSDVIRARPLPPEVVARARLASEEPSTLASLDEEDGDDALDEEPVPLTKQLARPSQTPSLSVQLAVDMESNTPVPLVKPAAGAAPGPAPSSPAPVIDASAPTVVNARTASLENEINYLLQRLGSPALEARRAARDALTAMGPYVLPKLIEHFPGQITVDPFSPATTLPPFSDCSELLSILASFGIDSHPYVVRRLDSMDALQRFFATYFYAVVFVPDAIPRLVQRLHDEEPRICMLTARTLFAYRELPEFQTVLEHLHGRLDASSLTARRHAAYLIGLFRDVSAVPLLIDFFDRKEKQLFEAVEGALAEITKQRLGPSAKKWREWWARNQARSRIGWLVDGLGSKEAAMRRSAAEELRAVTGIDLGYDEDAPRKTREDARLRWVKWWNEQYNLHHGHPDGEPVTMQ